MYRKALNLPSWNNTCHTSVSEIDSHCRSKRVGICQDRADRILQFPLVVYISFDAIFADAYLEDCIANIIGGSGATSCNIYILI